MKEYYFKSKKLGINTFLVKVYQKQFPYPIKSLGVLTEENISKEFEIFLEKEKCKDLKDKYFERMLISFEFYKQYMDAILNENNIDKFVQPLSDAFMFVMKFYSYFDFDCDEYISKYLDQEDWRDWHDKYDFLEFCQRYKNGIVNDSKCPMNFD